MSLDPRILDAVEVYKSLGCNQAATARKLDVHRNTLRFWLLKAKNNGVDVPDPAYNSRLGGMKPVHDGNPDNDPIVLGRLQPRETFIRDLPNDGEVNTYIITGAVNNSELHRPFWRNLKALAKYYDAELMVRRIAYNLAAYRRRGPGTELTASDGDDDIWYPPEVRDYICEDRVVLAPGLHWAGDAPMTATAVNPLSGYDTFTGSASGIFAATKMQMRSIASMPDHPAKLLYTTGVCTLRNYSETKTGQKADWHHVYGALIVEVDADGDWFVRQLAADDTGCFNDLDLRVSKSRISKGKRVRAFTPGDLHKRKLDDDIKDALFDDGGLVDVLQPQYVFCHDIHDHESGSHHNKRRPLRKLKLANAGLNVVRDELADAAELLHDIAREWLKIVIVPSNHHDHLERWLDETDWRDDPTNADYYLELALAAVANVENDDFDLFRHAIETLGCPDNVLFLARNESFMLDEVEHSQHGDMGPNGARGTLSNLSKTAMKMTIGHGHSAGIQDGCYQVGVMAGDINTFEMGYNFGPSSWSRTGCVQYPSGKRTLVTMRGTKWRAERGVS